MADRHGSFRSLETWAVATFDAVVLGLVGVLAGHANGALGEVLPDAGTVPGVLAFGYLWALVVPGVRLVLSGDGLRWGEDGSRSLTALLARGVAGGSLVGLAFAGGAGLAVGLVLLASGGEAVSVGLLTLFGAVGGAVVGALVGLALGLLDVLLARSADAVIARLAG